MSIVIVEDSKPMRNLVKRTLRQAGFGDKEVHEAANGADGLELIRQQSPEIVLTDWNMPEMSGIELLRALRGENNQVTVGFVTSEQSDEMRAEALSAGATFLIGKPFKAEEFNKHLSDVFHTPGVHGMGIPLKRWLEFMISGMKGVAVNPLGFASGAEVVNYPRTLPSTYRGAYLPFEGGDEKLWMCLFADERGSQSISRALFGMGPDEDDLDDEELGDAVGEVLNVVAGLVKNDVRDEDKQITLTIGLPHYMPEPSEVIHRVHKELVEVRVGPVSVVLCAVKVQ